jgi:methionyl-tRNA synthetase
MSRYYLTTAIDYVNSRPHLGTAYEKITADVIARYHRLAGDDVRFVMGNDEHSQNVFRRARDLGQDPLAYCDRMADEFRDVWRRLDISFDDFIRTTEPRHRQAVEAFLQRSHEAGDIYEGLYEGWYCVSCEEFKQERDLIEGRCPIHKRPAEWIKERNHFFRLSKYRDRLLQLYAEQPGWVAPDTRRNEMLRVLEGGLDDISVSRAGQAWGIPFPFDPSSVVYVWYDALINYLAAAGYGRDPEEVAAWWPARLHVIGKDITRFHCIVWPAMLMSAGLPLPAQVFGHGFVLLKGERMSKSLGTSLDPLDVAARLGPDPLRLYLVKEIVYGSDGDFTWDRFEEKYNVDLANNLGNLVHRVTAMTGRYRGGQLAAAAGGDRLPGAIERAVAAYRTSMDQFALDEACRQVFQLIDATNEHITASEPWVLARDGRESELDGALWQAAEALRIAAVLLTPVIPESAGRILDRLGARPAGTSPVRLAADGPFRTSGGARLTHGEALWPRLEPPAVAPGIQTKETSVTELPKDLPGAAAPAGPSTPAPATAPDSRIAIDDFMKVELRVARIVAAERVPNSKKLVRLDVDLGAEQRTIVAGIAEAYAADALVGRSVAIVANLKPAKLMGIESNGMVLAASPDGGAPILLAFDQAPPPGTRIR